MLVVTLDWTTVRPYPSARIHLGCQGGMCSGNFSHCSNGGFTQSRLQHEKHESTHRQTLWRRLCRVCIPAWATFPVTCYSFSSMDSAFAFEKFSLKCGVGKWHFGTADDCHRAQIATMKHVLLIINFDASWYGLMNTILPAVAAYLICFFMGGNQSWITSFLFHK